MRWLVLLFALLLPGCRITLFEIPRRHVFDFAAMEKVELPEATGDGNYAKARAIVFTATNCQPCQVLEVELNRLRSYGWTVSGDDGSHIRVVDIESYEGSTLARSFGVDSSPTTIVVSAGGELLGKRTGPMTAAQMAAWLNPSVTYGAAPKQTTAACKCQNCECNPCQCGQANGDNCSSCGNGGGGIRGRRR